MRIRRLAALALAAALLPFGVQAQDFEGTVTYRMSMPEMAMSVDMTLFSKGNKYRQETSTVMGNLVVIVDNDAGRMSMSMPGQRATVRDIPAGRTAEPQPQDDAEVTATGQTETIAGHACEHYVVKMEGEEVDICVATGLGFFMNWAGDATGGGEPPPDWIKERFADGFFPLRISADTPQGRMEMEAVSIERKALSDDLFRIGGAR